MAVTCELVSRKISIKVSTVGCMMNYVVANWKTKEEHGSLHDFGYAGLFYVTLASYLEHTIRSRITVRICAYLDIMMQIPVCQDTSKDNTVPVHEFGVIDCAVDGIGLTQVDFRDYNDIHIPINKELLGRVERMNRNSLYEAYGKLFGRSVEKVIDASILDDWDALAVIRNTYAHGAEMLVEYDAILGRRTKDTLDDTVSGRRLIEQATLGKDTGIPFYYMFTDRVMRHYYGAAQQIAKRLDEVTTNPAERLEFGNLSITPLPDLP